MALTKKLTVFYSSSLNHMRKTEEDSLEYAQSLWVPIYNPKIHLNMQVSERAVSEKQGFLKL